VQAMGERVKIFPPFFPLKMKGGKIYEEKKKSRNPNMLTNNYWSSTV
jgi:hypothetical protein